MTKYVNKGCQLVAHVGRQIGLMQTWAYSVTTPDLKNHEQNQT